MPFFGPPVEGWFLFDSLFLAYAIPAALYAGIGFYRLGPRALWQAALVLAAGFAFLWVTLEVRHFFHGDRLYQGSTGEAEWYAYSAAWLAFAAAGLGAALKWRSLWLRRASLLGLGLVVGKVFLSDMADLSGGVAGAFLHWSRRRSGRHRLRLSAAAAIAAQPGSDLVRDPHPPRCARGTVAPAMVAEVSASSASCGACR